MFNAEQQNPYSNVTTLFNCNSAGEFGAAISGLLNTTLYAPDWYISQMVSNDLLADVNNRLLKRKTAKDLYDKLECKFPTTE